MKKQITEPVTVTLDKARNLLFDFNAKVAFEEATGLSGLEPKTFNPSHKVIRGMLWAALLHEDSNLTLSDAGKILDGLTRKKFTDLQKKLFEAWVASMPEREETEATVAAENPTHPQPN